MKFFNLLRKELHEMVTVQTIISLLAMVVLLSVAGDAMTGAMEDTEKEISKITICDEDNTEFSKSVIDFIEKPTADMDNDVTVVTLESDDYAKELKRLDVKSIIIIPKGFSDQVNNGEQADAKYISKMTSLSAMSNAAIGDTTALTVIEAAVKSAIYTQKVSNGQLTETEITQLDSPIKLDETTIVGDKSASISASIVYGLSQMQGMFIPIIVMLLIMYSSQMILNAVSTEKIDKTLETLLSAPVSRMSVLSSKMLAAAIVAGIYAAVYMFGMNNMMSSFSLGDTTEYNAIIADLGLTLSSSQYVLVGLQMFVTLLIALSISLVLGALAKDAKSGQALIMPITIVTMIPYMLSMFLDINTLSPVFRYLVYAIPFTHTMMASTNVMFDNMTLFWGGFIYQIIFLIVCMSFAIKVFTSDRIFTMSISFGNKAHKTKKKSLFSK